MSLYIKSIHVTYFLLCQKAKAGLNMLGNSICYGRPKNIFCMSLQLSVALFLLHQLASVKRH